MTDTDVFDSAALLGDDHAELGAIAVERVGDRIAIALSRGKHPKGYPSLDPNEDAVVAATTGRTTLLAVADAHFGFDAARAAAEAIYARAADLLEAEPVETVRQAIGVSRNAIADALAAEPGRSGSRTTLAVAVLRGTHLVVGGYGDSQVVVVAPGVSRSLLDTAPFLGPETDVEQTQLAETEIDTGSWVITATDGLFDFLGRDWAPKLEQIANNAQPPDLAIHAVEAAFTGGAGDNIAIALTRVPD